MKAPSLLASAVAALLLGCGAAAERSGPEPGAGVGEYGKGDGFYSELGVALANDAIDRPGYATCEELPERTTEELARDVGLDPGRARGELHDQLRVVAFGRVLTLLGALRFMRAGDAYEPLGLPAACTSLPSFADYFVATERLNAALDFQRHALARRWREEGRGGDVFDGRSRTTPSGRPAARSSCPGSSRAARRTSFSTTVPRTSTTAPGAR